MGCRIERFVGLLDCVGEGYSNFSLTTNYTWVKTLDLRYNRVSVINVTMLWRRLPNLRTVDLRGNPIQCTLLQRSSWFKILTDCPTGTAQVSPTSTTTFWSTTRFAIRNRSTKTVTPHTQITPVLAKTTPVHPPLPTSITTAPSATTATNKEPMVDAVVVSSVLFSLTILTLFLCKSRCYRGCIERSTSARTRTVSRAQLINMGSLGNLGSSGTDEDTIYDRDNAETAL